MKKKLKVRGKSVPLSKRKLIPDAGTNVLKSFLAFLMVIMAIFGRTRLYADIFHL